MKKSITYALSIILLAIVLAGCSESAAKDDGKSARLAVDTAAGGSLQIRAAKAEGEFEKNDVQAELSNFAYGIDTINAILTEQADTGIAADYALLNSIDRGELVILSSLTRSTPETLAKSKFLAVKSIDKPADIKGKNIGVAKGTVAEYHWAKYLEHLQISEEDIHYVPYSTPDEAIVGMKKGDIDIVLSSGALATKFQSIDGVHEIDTLSSANVELTSYLVANRSFVEKNEEVVQGILKAIEQGIAYVKENPDGTADIAYKELKLAKEDVLRDLEDSNYTLDFTQDDIDHLNALKTWILDKGILKEDYSIQDKLYLKPLKTISPESVTYEQ